MATPGKKYNPRPRYLPEKRNATLARWKKQRAIFGKVYFQHTREKMNLSPLEFRQLVRSNMVERTIDDQAFRLTPLGISTYWGSYGIPHTWNELPVSARKAIRRVILLSIEMDPHNQREFSSASHSSTARQRFYLEHLRSLIFYARSEIDDLKEELAFRKKKLLKSTRKYWKRERKVDELGVLLRKQENYFNVLRGIVNEMKPRKLV